MIFRTAATSAAIAIGLAVVGAVAGPQWDPEPVGEHLRPTTSDTQIGDAPQGVAPVGTYEVREEPVTVHLDGVEVDGLLRMPEGAPEDVPGLVFVHGAGTGKASHAFTEAATSLASAGIATLVPDKRLDTYSTRHRDYIAMAADYLRSVDLLRDTPGVDPARVGVYSESEGTWVSPVMAVEDRRIAFQVLVSAPVVPPRQQAAYAVGNYLQNTDVPESVFRAIPRAVGMKLPGGGFEYADFDVRPWLERQESPILVVYGTNDASMPLEQGARQVIADTATGPDPGVTVRFYEGANHGMRVDGGLHENFARDVSTWIFGLPGTAHAQPRVAGAAPNQVYLAASVPQPQWYGNGDIVLGAVIGAAGLFVLGGVVLGSMAVARRVGSRRRPAPTARLIPGLAGPTATLATGAALTTAGLVLYLVAVARLALDYEKDALVVQGGWVGVRLLGLVTVVAAAVLLERVRDADGRVAGRPVVAAPGVTEPGPDTRPAARGVGVVAVSAAFWAIVGGSVALLVTLAYWGVYQLGI
ncbi:acyl-CoA thioester hydrolase/BAAT C-terminal domain-containing protein [Antribacter gilvus]|uniref:alpha/beta hydrolase family protein n=1 Tax=Antribacter gilvus TaxID=2304675 RepID=UPI000F76FC52|nr:acyl-CoA thioester hydrolase/BAAT C-terminal domain-containing protein [Antribacter gilvus]